MEKNRQGIADFCGVQLQDVDQSCIHDFFSFICFSYDKFKIHRKPAPGKTLVVIAVGPLHVENGMFSGLNLLCGTDGILSGDEPLIFPGNRRGGGLGVMIMIKLGMEPIS